jgi:hypothetical protein
MMVEQAKLYMLITNERGEMCVFLTPPEPYGSEPESPEIVYDGGPHALLYRSEHDTVILDYIADDRRADLADLREVLVVEYDPGELLVIREYMAQVNIVRKIPAVKSHIVTKEELKERLEKAAGGAGRKK